jgi:hypothetical protein
MNASGLRATSILVAACAALVISATVTRADELMDYRDDYRDAAVVPSGPLRTDYRVGHGYLTDEEARLAIAPPHETAAAGGIGDPAGPGVGASGRSGAGAQ